MNMRNLDLRKAVIKTAMRLNETGLSAGASGNVSARIDGGFLITPSGMAYGNLHTEDIVFVDFDGTPNGLFAPSSEWRFHLDIYRTCQSAGAVVHAHSPYATARACLNEGIPAFHYMVAAAGGKDIRCCAYELFGTEALSVAVLKALENRRACLMGNHGLIAFGGDLEKAFALALEVEVLAQQYQLALQMGAPKMLSDQQMDVVLKRFESYGENAQG